MSEYAINLDARELKLAGKQLRRLGSRSLPQVLARAVNRSLDSMKAQAAKEIKKELNLSAKIIKAHLSIQKANKTYPSGALVAKGKPVGLIHFGARETKKGVSVKVKRERKLIPHAYTARSWTRTGGRSGAWVEGNKSVFRRITAGSQWEKARKFPKRNNIPWKKLPAEYRLPIKRLAGPRVPDIMENESVRSAILKHGRTMLAKRFAHELDHKIKRLKGFR